MKTLTTLILRRPSRNQHMQKPSLKSNSYFFSSNRHQNFLRGCTSRLALNSTPFFQDIKLLRRCAEIKSKFAFFQEQRERFAIDSVVFAQDAFCLIPKIFNAVNVVLTVCKFLGMVDTVMDKTHVTGNEGIVEHDLDRTIDNLCSIASKSMHHIDRQVIEIMVSKPCP